MPVAAEETIAMRLLTLALRCRNGRVARTETGTGTGPQLTTTVATTSPATDLTHETRAMIEGTQATATLPELAIVVVEGVKVTTRLVDAVPLTVKATPVMFATRSLRVDCESANM